MIIRATEKNAKLRTLRVGDDLNCKVKQLVRCAIEGTIECSEKDEDNEKT